MRTRDPRYDKMVHADMAEPLSVNHVGDQPSRLFKGAGPPSEWKPGNIQRMSFDGFDLLHLIGDEFELEFTTQGHLIDFNFGDGPSTMRVNSSKSQQWHFRPYQTSFAPTGTDLYRHAQGGSSKLPRNRLIGLSIAPDYVTGLVSDMLDGRGLSFAELSPPERWPSMDRLQSALKAMFQAPQRYSRLTAEALANDTIMRAIMRWSTAANKLAPSRYKTDDVVVNRALQFIGDNLTNEISLADIAEAAGRDTAILMHVFKLATGSTPYAYLLGSRIDAAKRDLRASHLDIAAISRRYCFGSPSHFSTTFRKFTGASPTFYRKGLKK